MYKDISTSADYPKTLVVRNHEGGLIWQIYHVQKLSEAARLASNAHNNAFFAITLEDYQPEKEETWPDWRETPGGKEIISDSTEATLRTYSIEEAYEIAESHNMTHVLEDFLKESPGMSQAEIIEDFLSHYNLI